MKRLLCFYICTLLLAVSFAQDKPVTKLTLQQAVETGITNNFDVLERGLQAQTDEINWKQSKLNLFPDLNGSATHGINRGRSIDPVTNSFTNEQNSFASYGVSSGVLLFQGFAAQNAIKQNSLNYQASKMDWQQAKDNLTINIILAYLQVLNNEDQLVQTQNQIGLSKKQIERLEILDKEGAISPSDLSDLKGQYASDQLSYINTQNALVTSKVALAQLMNVPADKNLQLEKIEPDAFAIKYEATPEIIYQTALEQFAQIKAVELRKKSAEKALKVAKGELYPRLTFNGNAGSNYSSVATQDFFVNTTDVTSDDYVLVNGTPTNVIRKKNNFITRDITYNNQLNNNLSSSLFLNLNIPIFNNLQARNRVKLAKITLKTNELFASTTKTQLQQFIEQAYQNMVSAADRYKTLLEQVNAYSESFRAAEIRFNNGVGTPIDYLTAKNNLDRATINLISAKYDYALRVKILDYYQGKKLW